MPRTALTVTTSDRTGETPTFDSADQANGMSFDNSDQDVLLYVKNGHSAQVTITIVSSETVDEELTLAVADPTIAIAAGADNVSGPFPNSIYGNAGIVWVDIDVDTSVTIACLKMGTL